MSRLTNFPCWDHPSSIETRRGRKEEEEEGVEIQKEKKMNRGTCLG